MKTAGAFVVITLLILGWKALRLWKDERDLRQHDTWYADYLRNRRGEIT